MKTLIFIFATLATLLSLPVSANDASAEAAIRNEPKVKDILHQLNAAVKWQVGVLDDGSKRWGYAFYLCDVLREHGVVTKKTKPSEQIVRIVDIVKVSRGVGFRDASLGAVDCVTYDKLMP